MCELNIEACFLTAITFKKNTWTSFQLTALFSLVDYCPVLSDIKTATSTALHATAASIAVICDYLPTCDNGEAFREILSAGTRDIVQHHTRPEARL